MTVGVTVASESMDTSAIDVEGAMGCADASVGCSEEIHGEIKLMPGCGPFSFVIFHDCMVPSLA